MIRKRRTKAQIEQDNQKPVYNPRTMTFFYESDGSMYRWWNNLEPGDVFDIIDKEELQLRIDGAAMCKIRVVDHLPGFCDLGDNCPDHLGYH